MTSSLLKIVTIVRRPNNYRTDLDAPKALGECGKLCEFSDSEIAQIEYFDLLRSFVRTARCPFCDNALVYCSTIDGFY